MDGCGFGLGCQASQVIALSISPLIDGFAAAAERVSVGIPALFPFVAAVAGATVASFCGLVADRLPRMHGWRRPAERGLSLASPASHCDSCGIPLPLTALVPIAGWLMHRGECAACGAAVPPVYPAVEMLVAFLSMTIVCVFGPTWAGVSGCLVLWAVTLISWIDWSEQVIPDELSVPLLFAGLLASPFEADALARSSGAAVAALCMLGAFKLTSSIRDVDAVATGDVALGAAAAAWLGFCAVPAFLLVSCVIYVAYALPLRMVKGEVWVPMGPALSAGFVFCLLTGFKFAI